MKLSKYSIFHNEDGEKYIFHQISNALLKIDDELAEYLQAGKELDSLPADVLEQLESSGFIVNDDADETCAIRYANLVNRYNSKLLRVTILPTINCNFRCWYCYEEHKPSLMSEDDAQAVLAFIKHEAKEKGIDEIVLDWFGGEPLLRFSQIIYPLSNELKAWCGQNGVEFKNIITTNGSLIDEGMAVKMNEIGLRLFQITLDGGKECHNKVRYSPAMKNSYDVIVKNIHTLCHVLDKPNIELRINYTKENIDSSFSILDDFDKDIRRFILISPHVVWQQAGNMAVLSEKVDALRDKAYRDGFSIGVLDSMKRCTTCYIENMEQFVINYDMNVYKCTARDFDKKFSIGRIMGDGKFVPNELFYKYYTTSTPFFRKECFECNLLPSCLYSISCIQKKIEKSEPECNKAAVLKSLNNDISYKIHKA